MNDKDWRLVPPDKYDPKLDLVWVAEVKEVVTWRLIDKSTSPSLSIVYILQCLQSFRLKIGITQNLTQRIKDIQAMCRTELKLVSTFIVQSQEVESFFHREFDKYRLHGEWFKIPLSKIEFIEKLNSEYSALLNQNEDTKKKIFKDICEVEEKAKSREPLEVFAEVFGDIFEGLP